MKKFIIQSILFIILTITPIVIGILLFPVGKNNYLRAYTTKMEMLDSVPSPRIVFVGGSNLAFSLRSDIIADTFDINVVNSALHAGIGLRYMMNDIDSRLRNDDIVIIAPEYSQFTSAMDGNEEALPAVWLISDNHKILNLTFKQITNIISGIPRLLYVNYKTSNITDPIYAANTFNKFGDHITHLDEKRKGNINVKPLKFLNEEYCKTTSEKIKEWRKRGMTVLLIPPACIQSNYIANKGRINEIYSEMETLGTPFLIRAEAHTLPDSCAYDTEYHIRRAGANYFTEAIIAELLPLFDTRRNDDLE